MAGGKLSPRQKMINMMYLVLTALLALNVSKEVLNSFFEVNLSILKTSDALEDKNTETYQAFDKVQNKKKVEEYKRLANLVKPESKNLIDFMQKMKYDLVLYTDGQVFLGDGYNDEDKREDAEENTNNPNPYTKSFSELGENEKNLNISYLKGKSKRQASGDLFDPENKSGEGIATQLKENILSFKNVLLDVLKSAEDSSLVTAGSSKQIVDVINERLNISEANDYGDDKNQTWEYFNFYDMPSVAALTILSKWQADIKNMESEVVSFLVNNINTTSLKFSDVIASAIPSSNFVLKGEDFSSTITLTAYDKSASAEIYICDYDSLPDGTLVPRGNPIIIPLENGKGMYKVKANRVGPKSYKGFIKILQDDGDKYYGFEDDYVVANKSYSVSATEQNILYVGVPNPITVAVAGYTANDVSISGVSGIKTVSRKEGKYTITPSKSQIRKNVNVKVTAKNPGGKKVSFGSQTFVVRSLPKPDPKFLPSGEVSVSDLKNRNVIKWEMPGWFKFGNIKPKTHRMDVYVRDNKNQEKSKKGIKNMRAARSLLDNLISGNTVEVRNVYYDDGTQVRKAEGIGYMYTIE